MRAEIARQVAGGADAARRAAHAIVSRNEFHPAPRPLLEQARDWVFRQIADLLGRAMSGLPSGPVGAALAIVLAIVLVLLAARAIRGATANPVRPGMAIAGPRRPVADWLAEAAECESRGHWRAALRCRYRALVAELAARGLVEEIPGRTTGEYRSAVHGTVPTAASTFDAATDLFEAAWYGDASVHADDSQRFRTLADRVLQGVR